MESGKERKKPVSARGETPGGPVRDPADGNVDAGIPERLRPDGTAAWPPRAAGLGFDVPPGTDPADADEEARAPFRQPVPGRFRADTGKAAGTTPDRSAAGPGGREGTERILFGSGEGRVAAVRPARTPDRVRPGDGAAALSRPAPQDAVPAGRGETAAPARKVADEVPDLASAVGNIPTGLHPVWAGPGKRPTAFTAGEIPDRAALFPAGFRLEHAGGTAAGKKNAGGEERPEPLRRTAESFSGSPGQGGSQRVVGERRTALERKKVQGMPPTRLTVSGSAGEAVPAGKGSATIPDAVDVLREQLGSGVALNRVESVAWGAGAGTGTGAGTGIEAGRDASERDIRDARTDGALATAGRRKTAARSGRRARPEAGAAIDIDMPALREEKTIQIRDGVPVWKAGLPDLSGVVLKNGGQWKEPSCPRIRMRAAAAPIAAPESAPAVQVNATLRVDEEELVCAVERLVTRQARRG